MTDKSSPDKNADTESPIEEAIVEDAKQAKRGRYGVLGLIVAILFALFYVYELWGAISNLVDLPDFYDEVGFGVKNVPWWLLWVGVLIPIVIYALAFLVGRRRNVFAKALIFLVGLAVVVALGLGVEGLEDVLRPILIPLTG